MYISLEIIVKALPKNLCRALCVFYFLLMKQAFSPTL